jgi:transposase-like protein
MRSGIGTDRLHGNEPGRAHQTAYRKNSASGIGNRDERNGCTPKTIRTENREAVIRVPRNRNGTFESRIIPKCHKRLPPFNDRMLSMYSFGKTERDIKAHLEKVYTVEVSPEP